MKKAITIIFISLLVICSSYKGLCPVYASSDEWQNSDLSMQAQAFLAYCKSNNLVIEGSAADALTTFTTDTYYKICNTLGLNVTELQSNIKYSVDQNGALRFLFDANGVSAMNQVFSLFLQNNDLSVGDTADAQNNELFNGHYYTYDHYTCLCFEGSLSDSWYNVSKIKSFGTSYYLDTDQLLSMAKAGQTSVTVPFSDNTVKTWSLKYLTMNTNANNTYEYGGFGSGSEGNVGFYYKGKYSGTSYDMYGFPIVIYYNGRYSANRIIFNKLNNTFRIQLSISNNYIDLTNVQTGTTNIFITSNNITNNNYNDYDYTTINNEGDVYHYEVIPPTGDPSDQPWNPTVPNIPQYSPGDNTVVDLPDIDIPDLPSLNFSLGDLRNKFPFSIPFDIIALLSVLDGEPRAPVIDAHIPIGSLYDWHFQADFSAYDDTAALIRSVEFIGFCIGLIVITIRLVKG